VDAPTLDRTLTLPELAQAWGWPQGRLYRLCEAEAIPHLRIRGRLYFEVSAVEAWKAAHRRAELRQQDVRATQAAQAAARSRAEECAALGIPENHRFS
jgi:predicted DNA-binding transcriptional regulator AlpA